MKIGFIGAGNMGGAIIGGIVTNKIASPSDMIVSDKNAESLSLTAAQYGVSTTDDNKKTASESDILFLCVKPNVIYKVIDEIRGSVKKDTVIVSIAAGQSMKKITDAFGKDIKLVRVMPNTPALVGEGMAACVQGEFVSDSEMESVLNIFDSFGRAEKVSESMMDAVTLSLIHI